MRVRALSVTELLVHRRWLHRLAVQIVRDDDLARDLVQDTWLAAIRGEPPPGDDKVRPWLAGVLRNLARMSARTAIRRRGREDACAVEESESALPSPEELLTRMEAQELLVDQVRRLEEPFRTTILLLYFEGLPASDVARRLRVPDSTVRWRHRQALVDLRKALAERDPQRRRMSALLAPASYAAAVAADGGTRVVSGKALSAGFALMLASLLSLWPGRLSAPAERPDFAAGRALRLSGPPSRTTVASAIPPGARVVLPESAEGEPRRPGELAPAAAPTGPPRRDPPGPGRDAEPEPPVAPALLDLSLPLGALAGRVRCTTARLLTRDLNRLNKENAMKLTSPRLHTMVLAMLGALQQGGCASDDAGGIGATEDEVQPPAERESDESGGDEAPDDGDDPESCRADACAGTAGAGVYVGLRCDGESLFDMESDLTCADARERCSRQAAESPGESIYCEWNGIEVFRHEASDLACTAFGPAPERNCRPPRPPSGGHPCVGSGLGRYRGFFCGSEDHAFIRTENIDCQAALGNCMLNAGSNPDLSFYCEWNGREIYRSEAIPGDCEAKHGPPALAHNPSRPETCNGFHPCFDGDEHATYSGSFCGGNEFIRTPDLHCQSALGNCGLNSILNPTESIRCEWNGQEIYRQEAAGGSCDADGPACPALPTCSDPCAGATGTSLYRATSCDGDGGTIDVGVDLTCQEARVQCAEAASSNPGANLVCFWRNIELLRRDTVGACEAFPPGCVP